jgi:hypothetical protein
MLSAKNRLIDKCRSMNHRFIKFGSFSSDLLQTQPLACHIVEAKTCGALRHFDVSVWLVRMENVTAAVCTAFE